MDKRILHINQFQAIGSTGRIMDELCGFASQRGFECYKACAFSQSSEDTIFTTETMNSFWGTRKNLLRSRIVGLNGYSARRNTRRLIEWMDKINPNLFHLHNIHGNWVNLEMLSNYISSRHIPVVWTLHDTWSFTGRCAILKEPICEKWVVGCKNCPHMDAYPSSYFFDFSKKMWKDKNQWFNSINNLTIVSPSHWMDSLVAKSFLRTHNHIVIHNGIDVNVFHPVSSRSPYFDDIKNKKILLGVASAWSNDKGLSDFIKLANIINHDEYKIVLVGVDERRKKLLPKSILCINRTNNVEELAQIYSNASVFVNATYAESLGLTNIEANSCGTPVVTYKSGGAVETITNNTGIAVPTGDVSSIWAAIQEICTNKKRYDACRNYAVYKFDKEAKFVEYMNLYDRILNK